MQIEKLDYKEHAGEDNLKKIAFIAPDYQMLTLAREVLAESCPEVLLVQGLLSQGGTMAHKLFQAGAEIFISRGETASLIKQANLPVTVVEVPLTAFDLLRALKKASCKSKKVAVITFLPLLAEIKILAEALEIELCYYPLAKESEAKEKVAQAVKAGAEIVLGGVVTALAAKEQGCGFELIQSGREGISQAVREAKSIFTAKRVEQKRSSLFSTVLNYAYEGIIFVNQAGIVEVFNPEAQKITGIQEGEALGKQIDCLLPMLQLKQNMLQKREVFGKVLKIKHKNIVCNQLPVKSASEVSGAVATLVAAEKLQRMEEKLREKLFLTGHVASKAFQDIAGQSTSILKVVAVAKKYALTDSAILIYGETGTGKEVFAQAIHNYSSRKNRAFVAINCAALPSQILESELFGYMPGAFTGASTKGKPGLFELAHNGTIFLDEISELELSLQSKLLRVLEEKKIMRLGSDKLIPIDVRILAASNQDLFTAIKEKKFRADLYYRLNVLKLVLPSLKERREDLKVLSENFLAKIDETRRKMTPGALKVLQNYDWPGNIRELQNILQRICAVSESPKIEEKLVRELLRESTEGLPEELNLLEERELIQKCLEKCQGHYGKAAELLGMHRTTLWRKLKKYRLEG